MADARHNRFVNVRWSEPGASIGARRGEVVVCIPVYDAYELFVSCLRSVLAHTPPDVPILVCDDASQDPRPQEFVRKLGDLGAGDAELIYMRRERNGGFPENVNGAFAAAAPADVIVLNSDCIVAEGWIEGLRQAAYVDSRVATATALTNHGTVVSVPQRGLPGPLPAEWRFDDAAAAIRGRSLRIRPRLPTAVGHCLYVRRSALELVGDFDLAFSPGYGEEIDFSQRCLRSGLSHVLADDVLVFHRGRGSFGTDDGRNPIQEEHERLIAARYPYYHDTIRWLQEGGSGPLSRALGVARRTFTPLSVVIDARILTRMTTGTQLQVLEVIAALARTEKARISVVLPHDVGDRAAATLAGLHPITLLTEREAARLAQNPADVVHRPTQVSSHHDLTFLANLGDRLIITHQDQISYHNPSYFEDSRKWQDYCRLTRLALAAADHVIFVSGHARNDALAEDLVEPLRASVVHNGTDHSLAAAHHEPVPPRGAAALADGAQTILCLGTDFRHKNRIFALRMFEVLKRRDGWPGYLVFAGPPIRYGSSRPEESELLAMHPGLEDSVLDLAAVSEAEKAWLFERARLVLYPTVHEGFGLIPFEAAGHDVPCMWAPGTALSEVLPDSAAGIVAWDPIQSADGALMLLHDDAARARNIEAVRGAGAQLTWDATGARLLELYESVCSAPATPTSTLERLHGRALGPLSEDAMRLLGPDGALAPEFERPLLAVATHRQLSAPLFGAIKSGYRVAYRLRRRRQSADDIPPGP